jgi:hypothetical protein
MRNFSRSGFWPLQHGRGFHFSSADELVFRDGAPPEARYSCFRSCTQSPRGHAASAGTFVEAPHRPPSVKAFARARLQRSQHRRSRRTRIDVGQPPRGRLLTSASTFAQSAAPRRSASKTKTRPRSSSLDGFPESPRSTVLSHRPDGDAAPVQKTGFGAVARLPVADDAAVTISDA